MSAHDPRRRLASAGPWVFDGLLAVAAGWLGDGTRWRQEAVAAARELHDVVAHSMSIIAVQSGVGAHVLDSQPEEARKALDAVEATSRQALVEMRRLLGVLRQEAEPSGSLTPSPGLAEVDALAADVARAGARVEVRIEGTRPELPLGPDLSAHRIAQEALTNVVRHAGPATARVRIRYAPDTVDIEVVDDGRGAGDRAGRRPRHRRHARARRPVWRLAGRRPAAGRRLPRRRPPPGGTGPAGKGVRVVVADDQLLVRAGSACWSTPLPTWR